MKEHLFWQKGVLLEPYVDEDDGQNAPQQRSRPAVRQQEEPTVPKQEKAYKWQNLNGVACQQNKESDASHHQHGGAPNARVAKIRYARRSQAKEDKLKRCTIHYLYSA